METVVSIALGVFGSLQEKFADLLANQCGRLKGLARDIRHLQSEYSSMHAALDKYATLEEPDDQTKQWASLLRELAYDTEDLLMNFTRQLGYDERQDIGFKDLFRNLIRRVKKLGARPRLANEIGDLKARCKDVKDLKTSYQLDGGVVQAALDPRLAAYFAEEANIVGVDGPRDDLAKWMVEEEKQHHRRVLSIAGCGGLGKTKLANAVYHKIQGHFDCHAFVSVSQKPDVKKIIKDVISQVSPKGEFTKDVAILDEEKSIEELRKFLQDKRYLVIIDDIWSKVAWNTIKCAFPENNCSSRIMTTTRILGVARSCCPGPEDKVYEMPSLSDPHSEILLFFKRIFGPEGCCPDMLYVSCAILKKCGDLPLAIIHISSLLANKAHVIEEWEKVKRSIGSDLNKTESLEEMKKILSLSYNDLSPKLKTCMLYLSNFPEDYVTERERLVRRWIAEGLIHEERGLSRRQEVAENYFYELLNKSMIEPVDIGYDGKVRACRVHDMMLELILSKSIEDNFITAVNGSQTVWGNSECFIRRLSVQDIDQELASELATKDLSHIRSMTVTSSSCIKYLPTLAEFPLLRVLDFKGCLHLECLKEDEGSTEIRRELREAYGSEYCREYDMNGMKDLFYLKYLSFRDTRISKLPSGVMMLHNLVTLDLSGTRINELPAGIVRLIKLQHLLIGSLLGISEVKVPIGISNMTNLRKILGLNITTSSVGAVEELGNLINLNVLHVLYILEATESDNYKSHAEMLLSSLCKLGKLQSVRIGGGNSSLFELLDFWSPPSRLQSFEMPHPKFGFGLSKLPKRITSALTSLVVLSVTLSEVTEDHLHILGELPALFYLQLETGRVQNSMLHVKRSRFRSLNRFECEVREAVSGSLLFEEGAMPNLERLLLTLGLRGLASMADASKFYLGIAHLQCLKVVEVSIYITACCRILSSAGKMAIDAIRKEADLHPNCPRVTVLELGLRMKQSKSDDEVSEEQSDIADEVNEEQSDADEYWDAISSPKLEGNNSP